MEKSHLIMLDRYPVALEVDRYTDTGNPCARKISAGVRCDYLIRIVAGGHELFICDIQRFGSTAAMCALTAANQAWRSE
jgi:hypothetical protein